jgi:hypothetical protein
MTQISVFGNPVGIESFSPAVATGSAEAQRRRGRSHPGTTQTKNSTTLKSVALTLHITLKSENGFLLHDACITDMNSQASHMSTWRHEASRRLPELQSIIASPSVRTAAELWMELHFEFETQCREEPAPIDLLSRIWQYAKWSSERKDEHVEQAVIGFFFERIGDTRRYREVLPMFMSIGEYEQSCGLHAPQAGKTRK